MDRRLLLALLLAGCAQAPEQERPPLELPGTWAQDAPAPYTDGRWWRIYGEPALDRLVEEAVASNSDLAAAVARVDEARALLKEVDASALPTVDARFARRRTLTSAEAGLLPPGVPRELNTYRATVDLSWEIDLFGRLRAETAAARADLAASEAARDGVRLALAAQVANAWHLLQALDARRAIVERTLALRLEAVQLERKRQQGGVASEFDLRQLEAEAEGARAQLPLIERERGVAQSALLVLAGRSPKAVYEESVARVSAEQGLAPDVVPWGLPSELLLRRPDLVEAEQRLAAAGARVSVARAAIFPSISLTGFLGSESMQLSRLFTGPAGIWSLAAALVQPIFDGGRREARTEAAQARERQALAQYQGVVRNAFREVRDALAAQARAKESFEAESARVAALAESARLARLRLEHGLSSRLEVLDAERNLLAAQTGRIEAARAQRAAIADLFRALGG
jgi:multidrug efflux system outer membrane protein